MLPMTRELTSKNQALDDYGLENETFKIAGTGTVLYDQRYTYSELESFRRHQKHINDVPHSYI